MNRSGDDRVRSDPDVAGVAMAAFDDGAEDFVAVSDQVWDPIGAIAAQFAAAQPTDTVLDACCGAGASAFPLAAAVGPNGHVDAVDLSRRLVQYGSSTVMARGVGQLQFHVDDALTWADARPGRYDRTVCALGLMFMPDPAAAVRRLASATAPGGTVTVTTWAEGALAPLLPAVFAARDRLGASAVPTPPFAAAATETADAHRLLRIGERAGLQDPRVHTQATPLHLPGRLWLRLLRGTVGASLLDGLDRPQSAALADIVDDAMREASHRLDGTTLTLVGAAGGPTR